MQIDLEELFGGALLASATLEGSGPELPELPGDLLRPFSAALEALPRQWRVVGNIANSGPWLTFAALVEAQGLWASAWDLLAAMTTAIHPAADDPAHANLLAFLHARRGRVARTEGRVDVAADCFDAALMKAATGHAASYWEDVFPAAWLGRSVLAVERGNYPEARLAARRAMRSEVPTSHHAQAHQLLALIEQKAQRPREALAHLWHAYDASDGHPAHRVALLASMSDVIAAQGHRCAAVRGWLSVLGSPAAGRMIAPAFVALLDAFAHHAVNGDPCGVCATEVANSAFIERLVSGSSAAPAFDAVVAALDGAAARLTAGVALDALPLPQLTVHDQVEVTLARSRAQLAFGNADAAVALARTVQRHAGRAGFHERAFQAETLLAQIENTTGLPAIDRAPSARAIRLALGQGTGRHAKVVKRFYTLVSPTSADTPVASG